KSIGFAFSLSGRAAIPANCSIKRLRSYPRFLEHQVGRTSSLTSVFHLGNSGRTTSSSKSTALKPTAHHLLCVKRRSLNLTLRKMTSGRSRAPMVSFRNWFPRHKRATGQSELSLEQKAAPPSLLRAERILRSDVRVTFPKKDQSVQ